MTSIYKPYYMSNKAYDHITSLALLCRYIKSGSSRSNGISPFLNDLSFQTFTDTRPEEVIERHEQELAYGRAPTWTSVYPRRVRVFRLEQQALINYVKVAEKMGIIKDEPWLIGPSRVQISPIVSYVLEGIGLGWISPDFVPKKAGIAHA